MAPASGDSRTENASQQDPLSETILIGTPYKPVARLGRGGMGEVIEAEHVALGKPVVIKLLHKDLSTQPQQVERMRVEAQSLARIAHPNLVAVHDFGETPEGRPYIVMERLRGRTFREELTARGFLPAGEAIELVRQVLAGLSAAHAIGLVHRDIKLENLFLCEPDANGAHVVKVLDFGIAKVVTQQAAGPKPSKYQTATGVLLGTPRFLSPEQALGKPVDARTDVYSTGLVLYTLLCGRGPFQDIRSLVELLQAHAIAPPEPPSKLASQPISHELDRTILKALEKKPEARFQDAAAFSAELARVAARASHLPRWEHTEPLASSPRAQAIAETARAVLARAAKQPKKTEPMPVVADPATPPPSSQPSPQSEAATLRRPAMSDAERAVKSKLERTAPVDGFRAPVLPFRQNETARVQKSGRGPIVAMGFALFLAVTAIALLLWFKR